MYTLRIVDASESKVPDDLSNVSSVGADVLVFLDDVLFGHMGRMGSGRAQCHCERPWQEQRNRWRLAESLFGGRDGDCVG